jgi:hypothetical protein
VRRLGGNAFDKKSLRLVFLKINVGDERVVLGITAQPTGLIISEHFHQSGCTLITIPKIG